jgi:hypothetical protein
MNPVKSLSEDRINWTGGSEFHGSGAIPVMVSCDVSHFFFTRPAN